MAIGLAFRKNNKFKKENSMTQEDKELLLRDLCARLPYGVIMTNKKLKDTYYPLDGNEWQQAYYDDDWDDVPYLRPMSSMTEEEREEVEHLSEEYFGKALDKQIQESLSSSNRNESEILEYIASSIIVDWLNKKMFDFRGLIEKGLALAAHEGIYNY